MSKTVDHWLERLSPRTAVVSRRIFRRWMTWMKDNRGELAVLGPDELVEYQLDNRDFSLLDLVQKWLLGIDGRASYKKRLYSTILSFFLRARPIGYPSHRAWEKNFEEYQLPFDSVNGIIYHAHCINVNYR
jgi:hypothetical protein